MKPFGHEGKRPLARDRCHLLRALRSQVTEGLFNFVGTELDDESVLTKNAIVVHLEGAPFLQTNRLSVFIKHEVEVVSVLVIGLG